LWRHGTASLDTATPHGNPLLFLKFLETMAMADSSSRFGFVAFAETWNGRLAMLGFVIGLGTELLTGQGVLAQIGLG
jgi:ferrochelatase